MNSVNGQMNNLYGQTQIFGKATSTSNAIDNGSFNYVLPYNQSDFFSYADNITFADKSKCEYFDLNSVDLDSKCKADPDLTETIKDQKDNPVTLTDKFCHSRALCKNKKMADEVVNMDQGHSSNNVKYLDAITQTNLQTINIANLTVGILVMLVLSFTYSK